MRIEAYSRPPGRLRAGVRAGKQVGASAARVASEQEQLNPAQAEVAEVLDHLRALRQSPAGGRALHLRCGAGDIAQALCEHFVEVDAADADPLSVEAARGRNRHGDRCRYHVCRRRDELAVFADGTFDFVYAPDLRTPQRADMEATLDQLVRLLRPGGSLVFQLPSHLTHQLRGLLTARRTTWMDIGDVLCHLYGRGLSVVDSQERHIGRGLWVAYRYFVHKPAASEPAPETSHTEVASAESPAA